MYIYIMQDKLPETKVSIIKNKLWSITNLLAMLGEDWSLDKSNELYELISRELAKSSQSIKDIILILNELEKLEK